VNLARGRRARAAAEGLTLIEVAVTLAVLAILAFIAAPDLHDMLRAQRVKAASLDVFSGLLLARSEAIARNSAVSLVPSGGNWSAGWTIADASGEVVQHQDRMPRVVITGPERVTYNSAGRVSTGGASIGLVADGGGAAHARCIRIDLSGRPVQTEQRCP